MGSKFKEEIDQEAKRMFDIEKEQSICVGSNWLMTDGTLLRTSEHDDLYDIIADSDNKEMKEEFDALHKKIGFSPAIIRFIENKSDMIRLQCQPDTSEIGIEISQGQSELTDRQEKMIGNLLCNGRFHDVYVDIVNSEEKKYLWDSMFLDEKEITDRKNKPNTRAKLEKSLKFEIPDDKLESCGNIGYNILRKINSETNKNFKK